MAEHAATSCGKKAVETIKWIADYSPTEAKIQAQQFLDPLQKDNT
jgi:hypothetical protein